MLFKPALLSHSMKWQSRFSIERPAIIITNQGQQLIHHKRPMAKLSKSSIRGSESTVEREAP